MKVFVLAGGLALSTQAAPSALVFSAMMDGAQETPPVSTSAKALMGFELNATQDTMILHMAANGLSGPITAAHIHAGAKGMAGPAVVSLLPFLTGATISAVWTGFAPTTLMHFLAGDYYVNLHTSAHPNGEIRGQIGLERDSTWVARLTGAQETPANNSAGQGLGSFALSGDDSALTVRVAFTGLDSVIGAHIHKGPAGVAGPIVIDLTDSIKHDFISGRFSLNGRSDSARALLDSLRKGSLYVNVHTKAHQTGEIRGQLLMDSGVTLTALLAGGQEVPALTDSARGVAVVRLSAGLDSMHSEAVGASLSGDLTGAQLGMGLAGVGGTLGADLSASASGRRLKGDSVRAVSGANLMALLSGGAFLNLITTAHPAGEIRGQLMPPARMGFSFGLNGAKETPPVATNGFAAAVVTMSRDSGNVRFAIVADSLGSAFTMAHFHHAAAGVAGPIVFPITPFFAGLSAMGMWTARDSLPFDRAMASAFMNDSLYINLHTANHMAGEIRGQVAEDMPTLVIVAVRGAARAPAGPDLMGGRGRTGLMVRGAPGSIVEVTLSDLQGRRAAGTRLAVGADGLSRAWTPAGLRAGLYVASLAGRRSVVMLP